MKFLLRAVVALLAIVPVLCWPRNDFVDQPYPNTYPDVEQLAEQQNEMEPSISDEQETPIDDEQDSPISNEQETPIDDEQDAPISDEPNAYEQYNRYYYADSQGVEELPLPKNIVDDMKKQREAEQGKGGADEVQATSQGRTLRQGCQIALKVVHGRWLGSAGHYANAATCPGASMNGHDWYRCWGEVYQIYRYGGPGNICSGDYVGLYYPRGRLWFSMFRNIGNKQPCPGRPSYWYGFQYNYKWRHCGAEVLQVYARGKRVGQPITDQDIVSFYYPAANQYVQFNNAGRVRINPCPLHLSGNRRPPTDHALHHCYGEVARITIRP